MSLLFIITQSVMSTNKMDPFRIISVLLFPGLCRISERDQGESVFPFLQTEDLVHLRHSFHLGIDPQPDASQSEGGDLQKDVFTGDTHIHRCIVRDPDILCLMNYPG